MHLILIRPNEDPSIVSPVLVSHPTRALKHFEKAWSQAREEVKEEHPDGHQTDDIISKMETEGWKFEPIDSTKVID